MLTQMQNHDWLDVKQTAAELGQHPATVRRRIAAGELSAFRLGPNGRIRVPREALAAYVRPVVSDEERED